MRDEDLIDRRRFADLVDEALAIIRARCPDWTDHSPGDPGMTLLEVYAWLTETMLYRLNRLPSRLHLELLKLLGILPLPAAAAVSPPETGSRPHKCSPPHAAGSGSAAPP